MTTYTIQALPGQGNSESRAFGLNGSGEVAGIAFPPPSLGYEGVLWLDSSPVFKEPPGSDSTLVSVNDAGDAVGVRGFSTAATGIPILVRSGASADLTNPLGLGAYCTSINNAGVLCGWNFNNLNAFTYDTFVGKVTLIPKATASDRTVTSAINQAGHVVGIVEHNAGNSTGFFYDGALHDLGDTRTVYDINDNGLVAGSIGDLDYRACIWDVTKDPPVSSFIPLPTSDDFLFGHAYSINNQAIVVGTCWTPVTSGFHRTAYVYADGASTDLNALISAPGWQLQYATHINDAGMITGFGSFNGQQTAFLLTPAPQPPNWGRVIRLPELVATLIFGGVTVGGSGSVVIGWKWPSPVGPGPGGWTQLSSSKRDALIGMALDEVAKYISDARMRELVKNAILEGVRTSVGQLSATSGMQLEMAHGRPAIPRGLNKGQFPELLRQLGMV